MSMLRRGRDFSLPQTPERELGIRTRRAFLTMGVGALASYGAWAWLQTRPEDDSIPWPFRRMLRFNERLEQNFFSERRPAAVVAAHLVQPIRTNGLVGLSGDYDPGQWLLNIDQGHGSVTSVTLDEIRALPRIEQTTQLNCIEGWSVVIRWTGARFSDFCAKFAPGAIHRRFVGMQTPSQEYYVGLDMPSALHSQTLLCYEMNGAPLAIENGAPLRLRIPTKYGIKNIKRIGTITYMDQRPADYWAEQGYDWYAGL
jgi:DMSO/TMAO reductase YedYZ molybdopterin-dependent catalytic subunit